MGCRDGLEQLSGRKCSLLAADALERHSGIMGSTAKLVASNVGSGVKQHGVTGLGMNAQGNLIGHGPGRYVHGVIRSEHVGNHTFKRVDGRIVVVHIVTDLRVRNCVSHAVRRLCDGVAPEVNHVCCTKWRAWSRATSVPLTEGIRVHWEHGNSMSATAAVFIATVAPVSRFTSIDHVGS